MSEHQVVSPLPGVVYRKPAPDQPAFVEEGDAVTADQTICLVEIMKQFTEVPAGVAGTVMSFAVGDEAMVDPGDVIATIDTA